MKNLKTIRKHNSTEEGFSMVTAAGFGLVIMMIGLTIMSRSIKDSTVSASQKINNRSLAAAESGVSMYLSLLNKKGGIALPTKSSANWAASGLSADEIAKTTGWQDIVTGNRDKGQYKLISYVPDGSGKAILRVQGRVNQTGTGTAATEDISTGMTTVEAIIGVTEGAGASSLRAAATQITANPADAAAAAVLASAAAKTASDAAVGAVSLVNNLTASTANNAAIEANTIASGANTVTTPTTPATVAAANATQSANYATNSAASATHDAQTAANAPGANATGTAANTAAVTAATAAATANTAAATANTAAATANTAASTGDTTTATTAATTAATAATAAATAATTADTAAQSSGTGSSTSGSGTSSSGTPTTTTTTSPVTASATATTKATEAVTAANTAITASTIDNNVIASTANTDAAATNTTASAANTTTTPSAPATTAAAAATQSAIAATSFAASAVTSAKAAAGATDANVTGSGANTAAVTAAAAAANANTAAAAANTAAAAANTAASTGNTTAAESAATTAATAATTAATAATSAQTAAQLFAATGTTRFPGLWLINGPNNASGDSFNQTFNAYGLVTNTPATSLWTSPNASALANPKDVARIEVPNSVSKTPPAFAMSKCLLANANPTINPSFLNSVDLATRIPKGGDVTFPATGDRAGIDGVYRYYASDLNLEGNTKVRFRASAKVIIHLQGDMETKGNIDIVPCDGSTTCNLNNLVIYGHKPNGKLLIKGTNTVGAFIIAPTYSAGIAGGGNGEGYKGALWAREWTSASNSNKFVVNQDGNEDQNLACPYTNPSIQVISQAIVPNSTVTTSSGNRNTN